MLKRLAILALAVASGHISAQIPRQGRAEQQHSYKKQEASYQRFTPISFFEAEKWNGKGDAPDHKTGYWKEAFSPPYAANWALFLVGFAASLLAWRTLVRIREQAQAGRISAEASLSQAELLKRQMDMMVHKDQARLNLDPQPLIIEGAEGFFYLSSSIELKNLGESKAYITFAAGRLAVVPSGQWPLPQPTIDESFLDFAKTISPSEEPIYFPLSFEDAPLDFDFFLEQVNNGSLTAYLYGFIEWETLGIRKCRNFGYTWMIDHPDGVRTAEQIVAEGRWNKDVRQNNSDEPQNPN